MFWEWISNFMKQLLCSMMLNRLLLVLFLFGTSFVWSQTRQYHFARIDVNNGLSHNLVNSFLKDSRGFMWIGTLSGLNRYDGYSVKIFRNVPGDTTSIISNDINKIFEGPDGKIWVYTYSGNSIYDPDTETFHRNTNSFLTRYGIAAGLITSVLKDSKGFFWFIHYNQGLYRYDPVQKKTIRLQKIENDNSSIATNEMHAIVEDADGNFWLTHKNGIFEKLDGNTLEITYRNDELKTLLNKNDLDVTASVDSDKDVWLFVANSNEGCFYFSVTTQTLVRINSRTKIRLNSDIVRSITQDARGMIWIGTDHGGINLIDKKSNFDVRYILHDDDDKKSISQNSINALYKDNDGIIWIGTYKEGVSYYHENIFRFQVYKHQIQNKQSLPFNDINAFAEDPQGNIWIGTNGGGLLYFDRKTNSFKQFVHDAKDPSSISSNVIVSLLIDHENILWIGTYYGGVDTYDGRKFNHYRHDNNNPKSLGDESAWEILEDSKHNLWIGTLKGGVDVYDREKKEFFHYRNGDFNSIHTTYVPALMEDRDGNMWIGTGYGIDILEKQSGRFVHYLNDIDDPTTISNNSILSIIEDSRGMIWIGTHGGLNLFNKGNKTFRAFTSKDGLPHNSILTLVEDENGRLWMGTPNGLSRLTVDNKDGAYSFSFTNYDESDGLQGKAFNENAVLRCSSGELLFGGSNGFNIFHPYEIGVNTIKPNVALTDFQVFNKSVKIGEDINGDDVLPKSVSNLDKITLSPHNNVFSIEFAALNFFHPEKSHYKYILEGFNKEWLPTDASQRRVTFTNLDPGDYTFKVMASNNDGVWNETPTSIKITVLPPFWRSNLALALYAIIIMGSLYVARWLILTKERMNYNILQERRESQRMHELDMMKIRFFTNVSHEFRTPLTLILTPIEKLLKQPDDEEKKKQYLLIQRNAKRLLNLVNQLLDFRKMEVQEIRFNPSEGDIVKFVRELVYSFSDISEKKNIRFSFSSTIPHLETLFDQDKIEKIIFNLLSNAFKFTSEYGSVGVALNIRKEEQAQMLEIKVTDSGIGIPSSKHEKIFERFFQNDLPDTVVNQGSGIGLSITREFVKIHGGSITVESEPGKGSCFTVLIPLMEIPHVQITELLQDIANPEPEHEHLTSDLDPKKPSLLLVEDNEDFRFYLKDNLRQDYSIIEASNGKQALQKALSFVPDLIVSDVMMPEMNGIEFCREVKSNPHTSHIPVILLTARTSEEQKMEGFETGANDYITKPFNFEILQSRIKNLIAQRELFQKVFQKHFDVKATDIQITSLDEKLIQNAIKVVEDNIANADFSVEELSRELAMSRVHLYKKLLSLTGKSPIEFIRTIRLQRAAQLLEKSQLTVAEVAYQVGFNNPKYFTKYFKDEFQILPSAYASGKRIPLL
jgi:signal transduction histidine kinase/ligand-binding sensor domain-containing protein/DNA-binding response OmpR family regulator